MNEKTIVKMKTPITYYGGKQRMLPHIRPLIPEHQLYCEPFAGGAAVFFDKKPVTVNVINDLNGELINFYRVVSSRAGDLRKKIAATLHCRKQHEHAWHVYNNPDFFDEVERAWAIFALSKLGFSGQLSASFGFERTEGKKARQSKRYAGYFTTELVELLQQAIIECDDAFKVIRRYDCVGAWHFIDPPYVGSDMGHYGGMFNEQSLSELLALCATLKGKFMLTMYPNEMITAAATENGWAIHRVERMITASKEKRRRKEEWMVCSY